MDYGEKRISADSPQSSFNLSIISLTFTTEKVPMWFEKQYTPFPMKRLYVPYPTFCLRYSDFT